MAAQVKQKARRLFEMQDIEIKTKSVENMLLPLIKQVTTLQDNIPGHIRRKKLRDVFKLIQIVDKATDNFTTAAENIAADNPDFQDELWLAIEEVTTCGNLLHEAAHDYTTEVMVARKRDTMEQRAADLLKAVTRLLVIIDLVDINELVKATNRIDAKLQNLKQVKDWKSFVDNMKAVAKDFRDVSETAIARQKELKNSTAKQLLVSAHAELSQQSKMLITSTKTFLNHPNDEAAIANRDYTIDRLSEVLRTIARLAEGENPEDIQKESDEDSLPSPEAHPVPDSPVRPPSLHMYPIEFYSSLPTPLTVSSEDVRRPHRVSGDFDHLHSAKRDSGQFDHLNSQDTYSSSSSFSAYHPETDGDDPSGSKLPAGMTGSKIYQVSSGTLPVMQVNSTKVSHADPTQGTTSASADKHAESDLHQVVGGESSQVSYPRGHTHSTKVSSNTTSVAGSQGNRVTGTVPVHNKGPTHHLAYPRGHEHSTTNASMSGYASGQPLRAVTTVTTGSSHKPTSTYPRGHSHYKSQHPSSPTRAGGLGAHLTVTTPPKRLQKSIENLETILEQTANAPEPPPAEAKAKLQAGFDSILNAASIIADFESTRDQHGLLAQCDVVRQKLQSLLKVIVDKKDSPPNDDDISTTTNDDTTVDESVSSSQNTITSDVRGEADGGEEGKEQTVTLRHHSSTSSTKAIRRSVQLVEEETATLRAELRKAMIDHVSDTFVDPCVPLTRMVASAKQGNRANVDKCADQFLTHAEKIVHVANLVCSLTNDGPANREVKLTAKPIESLKHQVVSAAQTLAGHHESESALQNMTAFKDLWIEKLKALTDAVDKVIPLHDFIAVTEAHIREDSRRLVEAMEVGNHAMSIGCANVIQGRYDRLVQMIDQDMMEHEDRYAPDHATALRNTMDKMTSKVFPEFQSVVQKLCGNQRRVYDSDIRHVEDHLQNINDGIRDMRIYILRTRTKEELQDEPDVDDILSNGSSSGLLSSSGSFEFINEEMFSGGQSTNVPSPVFNRASKHGQNTPPKIEVDIEEMEVTGQQYQSMLSYPSMNILEEIKEEDEEETTSEEEDDDGEQERQRQLMEEEQRKKEEQEKRQLMEEQRKKEEQEKEEAIRKKNEELLSKNFKQRKAGRMKKASSDLRLQEDRPNIEDEDYMTMTGTMRRRLIKRTPSVAVINETETAKAVLAQLSVQQQEEIAKEQERLEEEHKVFEEEVNQWDDTSNDIIVLAKEMCWMVMDMSDFLSGEGQLLTTMDVINTAKDVTLAAGTLTSLAQRVSDVCPDGPSKNDLLAYLDRIKLFCNQLKISSAVLTDLENVKGSADNINNLLISAKSLMNTVVMVVKGCYVASKAIKRNGGKLPIELMQWRMMVPKKKHLFSNDSLAGKTKDSKKYTQDSAIMELGAFRGRDSVVDSNEDTMARVRRERNMKRHRL